MDVKHDEILSEPACAAGCDPCVRSCALARIKLAWWEREEKRLLLAAVPALDPHRGAWLSELAEAAERLQALRQQTRPCVPSCPDAAFPEGSRGGRRAALLH